MTTNVTYGVTSTEVGAYLPSISLGTSSDPITSARLTTLIGHGAARLNGVLIGAGLSPASLSSDASSVAYLQCQQITIGLCLRHILAGLTMGADIAEAVSLAEWAESMLEAISIRPQILGASSSDVTPEVRTSVDLLNLDTSSQALVNKRRYFWQHDSQDGSKTFNW